MKHYLADVFLPMGTSEPRSLYLANRPSRGAGLLDVQNKHTGEMVWQVAQAGPQELEQAFAAAAAAEVPMGQLPSHARRTVLEHVRTGLAKRADELTQVLVVEGGKPLRDARSEVARAQETFRLAAEEVGRAGGEMMKLDTSKAAESYRGLWKRVPVGVCSFIAPFNFPLNLVAHKVAPAIAAGCPFVLKPASFTPTAALILGELLAETDLPPGAFSILPCPRTAASVFATDPRARLLSFTGSDKVGWELKAQAGKKQVVLELGGNAAAIVHSDWDLSDAVERLLIGIFAQSGQSCISVQRVLVQDAMFAALRDALVARTKGLRVGAPGDAETVVGPLIQEKAAARLVEFTESAKRAGATVLCGGARKGSVLEPTLLTGVPHDHPFWADEAFGPIAVLESYRDFDDALTTIDDSRFGLQAGVFTRDAQRAFRAWDRLHVGGVLIGDVPTWRSDAMPYGGSKDSGLGREGVATAIEAMSEPRVLVFRTPPT